MGKPGRHYNTEARVRKLEALIRELPDPSSPAPPQRDRPHLRTARKLDGEQVRELDAGYRAGATVFELGKHFGIDRRTVGALLKRHGVETHRRRPRLTTGG